MWLPHHPWPLVARVRLSVIPRQAQSPEAAEPRPKTGCQHQGRMDGSLQLGTRPLSAAHSEMVQTAGRGPAATQNWAPLGPESAQHVLSNQRVFVEEQDLLSAQALVISWGPEKSCFCQWAHSFLAYALEQELNNTALAGCIKLKLLSPSSPLTAKLRE